MTVEKPLGALSLSVLLEELTGLQEDLMLSLWESPETTSLLLGIQNDPQLVHLDYSTRPGQYTVTRLLDALDDLSDLGLVSSWPQRQQVPARSAGLPDDEGDSRQATWWHLTEDGYLVAKVVGQRHRLIRQVDEPLGGHAIRVCQDGVDWPFAVGDESYLGTVSGQSWSHPNARSLTVAYDSGFCHVVVHDDGAVLHGPHWRAPTTLMHPHRAGSQQPESRPSPATGGPTSLHRDTMRYLLQSAETTMLLLELVNDPRAAHAAPGAGSQCTEERLSDVLGDLEAMGVVRSRVYGVTEVGTHDSGGLPEHALHRSTVRWWWLTQAGRDFARRIVAEDSAGSG